jgi:hypothetical protein
MKQFISRVQNLSRKAAEVKAAMQQVPPKVAEIREAVAATTGQLQQLKSEIQYSVADLKADHEDHLSEALQEINGSADVFAKAGFVLSGVDLEISPVQRLLVHLAKVEDVHAAILRSLLQTNQHRRTTRAILSSLLQAKQMAETMELGDLIYTEVIVGIGPIPSVRLCWRPEETEPAPVMPPAPAISAAPPVAASAPLPAPQPQSMFGTSSFFDRRETNPAPTISPAITPSAPESTAAAAPAIVMQQQGPPTAPTPLDPLARFKKMPELSRPKQ